MYLSVMIATLLALAGSSIATVQEFTSTVLWQSAVGPYSTISFADLPDFTFVTNQYQHIGASFTGGTDFIFYTSSYLNDGVGLNSNSNTIDVKFDQPMTSIASAFPGGLVFVLYKDGLPIYTSSWFGVSGEGNFGGILSSQPFDEAEMFDPAGNVSIDDLYFGPPVPAPSSLALLASGSFAFRRRHRT